jgi:hypothetical protein
VWERDENDEKAQGNSSPFDGSSYWDCIFTAKLLIKKDPSAPPVLVEMQKGQVEAVATPFTQSCENFKFNSEVTANSQAANTTSDYQLAFEGVPSSKFPQKHWFSDKTFVAPCSGWYSAELQATGLKAPKDSLKLVSTIRYGQPVAVFGNSDKPSPKVVVYLYQYEALGLVLAASKEPRSIEKAKLVLKWDPHGRPAPKK